VNARDPVITGLGVVSAIGSSPDAFWDALLRGRSGVRTVSSFDASGYPSSIGCEIVGFDPGEVGGLPHPPGRAASLAAAAGRQALDDAGLSDAERGTAGLCLGTTMGESCWVEAWPDDDLAAGVDRVPVEEVIRSAPERVGADTAALLGVDGEVTVIGGACAAGNFALGRAADLIRIGRADRVLAGGVDAFSRIAFTGFARLGALAATACRPFSADREGLVLGEGAAVLVVESWAAAAARGAKPLAHIAGFGLSSDAFHIVAPEPTGAGAARAMRAALREAGRQPRDVDYVCAHGTGTGANDRAEVAAASAVFAEATVPMSSIKALTGHALGASSALEAAACVLALGRQTVPPTWNFLRRDPDCDWDVVPNAPRRLPLDVVVSNAYAFGGSNTSLVLARADP
jgi:3-oxoacyl-[acyl-carrier-protein] synthase II